jgi:proliferating cell nuclear antigen
MENNNTYENEILVIRTIQTAAIRILIEALKEILTDTNLIFDKSGIKIMTTDSTKTVLIHMKLESDKFEEFYCQKEIKCGISMMNLYKLIKTISNNDTLTLYIKKNNTNKLGIKIHNSEKKTQTTYELNLLDIPSENLDIPPVSFDTELTFPSNEFQKIIRDMTNIGNIIDIECQPKKILKLSCQGDFASQETLLGDSGDKKNEKCITFNNSKNQLIHGRFSLKYLILFTKCTNLCNQIQMYIKNDYPLIIQYSVASLGDIKLCLAPSVIDN